MVKARQALLKTPHQPVFAGLEPLFGRNRIDQSLCNAAFPLRRRFGTDMRSAGAAPDRMA